MATVPPSPRITTSTLASSSAGPFLLGFRLFETDAVSVFVNDIQQDSGFTLSAAFNNGYDDNATVTFDTALEIGDVIVFAGDQVPQRQADYLNTDGLLTKKLNIELARIWASLSEIRSNVKRAMKVSYGSPIALDLIAGSAARADRSVAFDDTGLRLVAGPSSDEISSAQGYAESAGESATAAAGYAALVAPYESREAIEGASIPTPVQRIAYLQDGMVVSFIYDPAGNALTTEDGKTWSPDGDYLAEHFGARGDGVVNDGVALKAAAASGKHIKLTRGRTYLMDSYTIICATDGQRFYGGGRLLKTNNTFDADDASTGGQDAAKFFKINGVNAVDVTDLDIQYTGSVTPRVYGITVENAARTKIRGNRFLGNVTGCFIWKNSDQTEFSGNTSAGGVFCIAMGGDGAGNTDGPVTNTLVVGNIIRGCVGDAIDPNWDCQNMVIRDNILLDNGTGSAEEDIDVGGGESFGIVVAGNLMDSGGRQKRGITVKLDTKDVVVRDNMIYNCDESLPDSALIFITGATSAIPPKNVLIQGNKGSGAYFGVYCLEGPNNVTIKDNTLDVLSEGIRQINPHATLGNGDDYIIENNVILRTGGTLTSHAVHLQYVDGFKVSGNVVSGGASFGILALANCSNGIISENLVDTCNVGIACLAPRCKITGNKVTGCNSHGINLQADHLSCVGNQCWDNSGSGAGARGILLTAGSDFAVITGNQCWDTRGTKLQNGLGATGACDRCIVQGNMLYDNVSNMAGMGSLTNSIVADNITT